MSKTKLLEDYGFPSNLSSTSKVDVIYFLTELNNDISGYLTKESGFKKYFPELYNEFLSFKTIEECDTWSFTKKLYHFLKNDIDFKLGICIECKRNRTMFINFKRGYLEYCSRKCCDKSIKHRTNISNSNKNHKSHKNKKSCLTKDEKEIKKYGKLGLTRSEKNIITRIANCGSLEKSYENSHKKNIETCMKRYNCKNGGGTKESIEKGKQTKLKNTGYESNFQDPKWKEQIKLQNLQTFGAEYFSQTKEWKEKTIITNLKNTGKEWFSQTKEYTESSNKKCIELYGGKGFASPIIRKKEEEIIEDKFGTKNYTQSQHFKDNVNEYVDKGYKTRKNNGTECSSSIEIKIKNYFEKLNIEYYTQYKSNKYPFHCDFYLPMYDLYIEIQGHWTHGKHPFNENNIDDINLIEKWKLKSGYRDNGEVNQYSNAIKVWTISDPLKRKTAKENNLNYLEIFSTDLNECIFQIEQKIKELEK